MAKEKANKFEQRCNSCPLFGKCKSHNIGYRGNIADPKFILIGEAPGHEEDNIGKNFVGRAGKTLYSIIDKVGITDACRIENVVRCAPYQENSTTKVRTPTSKEIACCRGAMFEGLLSIPDGSIIVPLGNPALKAITGRSGITAYAGRVMSAKIGDRKFVVIPNVHPSYVNRMADDSNDKTVLKDFVKVFYFIRDYADGKVSADGIEGVPYEILRCDASIDLCHNIIKDKNSIDHIYFDIETSSLLLHESKVIGYSLRRVGEDKSYYMPVHSCDWEVEITPGDAEKVNCAVYKMITELPIVGHNLKFDISHMVRNGIARNIYDFTIKDDTLILAHLIHNRSLNSLELDWLCRARLGVQSWKHLVDDYVNTKLDKMHRTYSNVPTSILGKYGSYDTYYGENLYQDLLQSYDQKYEWLRRYLISLMYAISDWELSGIMIDINALKILESNYKAKLEATSASARMIGAVAEFERVNNKSINLNSDPQIKAVMFDMMGFKVLDRTATKVPKVDKDIIERYLHDEKLDSSQMQFIELLSAFRKTNKILTSYINVIPNQVDASNVYRSSFNPCGTTTGRLSSMFHSMPSKNKDVKKVVVSRWKDEGGVIIVGDFAKLEPCIMASLSRDRPLVSIFRGLDYPDDEILNQLAGNAEESLAKDGVYAVLIGHADALAVLEMKISKQSMDLVGLWLKYVDDRYGQAFDTMNPKKYDVYKMVASEDLFFIPQDQIDYSKRQFAKAIFLGIIYGVSSRSIYNDAVALGLHIDEDSTEQTVRKFYHRHKMIEAFINERHREADRYGSITTVLGRKIPIPEVHSKNRMLKNEGYRKAQNYPIQSPASEVALGAFYKMWSEMKNHDLKSMMVGSVHDSTLNDVHPTEIDKVISILNGVAAGLKYDWLMSPLVLDISIGISWGDAIPITGFGTTNYVNSPQCHTIRFSIKEDTDSIRKLAEHLSIVYKVSCDVDGDDVVMNLCKMGV